MTSGDSGRAGVMTNVQDGKVQYLPVADPTFNAATPTDQYALVPSSADGSAGTWALVPDTDLSIGTHDTLSLIHI